MYTYEAGNAEYRGIHLGPNVRKFPARDLELQSEYRTRIALGAHGMGGDMQFNLPRSQVHGLCIDPPFRRALVTVRRHLVSTS